MGMELFPRLEMTALGKTRVFTSVWLLIFSGGDSSNDLEFLCSACPDCLEVQKVYVLRCDRMQAKPYMRPDIWSLKRTIQKRFIDYLEAMFVNDDISVFLHQYMTNKER